MSISLKDIIPLTKARAKLTELREEVRHEGGEKIITKNGECCAALIDAERLDPSHPLPSLREIFPYLISAILQHRFDIPVQNK